MDEKQMQLEALCRKEVLDRVAAQKEMDDASLYVVIDEVMQFIAKQEYLPLALRGSLRQLLFNSFRRLDILQELLEDDSITEIMVNGHENIYVEQQGKIHRLDRTFESREKLEDVIQQIVARVNRVINIHSPIVDARLADGSRINVVLPPISLEGPILTIRKFARVPITMDQLVAWGSIGEEVADFLKTLVRAKYNIFISGGTGCGKTTFLNALSQFIPHGERVITIEDSAELQLQDQPNLVRMEARQGEEENCISIRQLIRCSLRMNPDRIIVGEVRGEETLEMLTAMSVGQDGSLSTGHGNNPADMLLRLATMVMMGSDLPMPAILNHISSSIDILVHLGKLRDGSRKVLSVMEVGHVENGTITLTSIYEFTETGVDGEGKIQGVWAGQAAKLANIHKLSLAGLSDRL